MRTLPEEIRLRCTKELHEGVRKYAIAHGMTVAQAARDLLRRQLRYVTWRKVQEGKGPGEEVLRRYARTLLEKRPDLTKAQLGYNVSKRVGRFVDMGRVDAAVDAVLAEREAKE